MNQDYDYDNMIASWDQAHQRLLNAAKAAWVLIYEQMDRMDDESVKQVAEELHAAIQRFEAIDSKAKEL